MASFGQLIFMACSWFLVRVDATAGGAGYNLHS